MKNISWLKERTSAAIESIIMTSRWHSLHPSSRKGLHANWDSCDVSTNILTSKRTLNWDLNSIAKTQDWYLTDSKQVDQVIGRVKPNLINHCVGLANINRCEDQPGQVARFLIMFSLQKTLLVSVPPTIPQPTFQPTKCAVSLFRVLSISRIFCR